jgi:translation initiation factor 2 beta subunit (eIF-2beta)/eIF-5
LVTQIATYFGDGEEKMVIATRDAAEESRSHKSTDWESLAASMESDPAVGPEFKNALAEALEQDPASAVRDAESFYRIMLERATVPSNSEWKWRKQPTLCWVCSSFNTRLVGATGYGIVHECLDCGDQFLLDSTIQWTD